MNEDQWVVFFIVLFTTHFTLFCVGYLIGLSQ